MYSWLLFSVVRYPWLVDFLPVQYNWHFFFNRYGFCIIKIKSGHIGQQWHWGGVGGGRVESETPHHILLPVPLLPRWTLQQHDLDQCSKRLYTSGTTYICYNTKYIVISSLIQSGKYMHSMLYCDCMGYFHSSICMSVNVQLTVSLMINLQRMMLNEHFWCTCKMCTLKSDREQYSKYC